MTYFIIRTSTTLNFREEIVFASSSAARAEQELETFQDKEQESTFRMVDESFTCIDTGDDFQKFAQSMTIGNLLSWVTGKNIANRKLSLLRALGEKFDYRCYEKVSIN